MLADSLVQILVCPKSKQRLIYFPRGEGDRNEADGFLLCPASRLRYPIHGGVPAMLIEEATPVDGAAIDTLVARARELGLGIDGAA